MSAKPKGFVAFLSLMILMAVILAVGLTISSVGHGEIVLSGVFQDGEQAFSVADACTEEGVSRLKANSSFTGTNFTLDGGTCVITVANLGGTTRLITGTGTYNRSIRIVVANVSITTNGGGNASTVKINNWTESP